MHAEMASKPFIAKVLPNIWPEYFPTGSVELRSSPQFMLLLDTDPKCCSFLATVGSQCKCFVVFLTCLCITFHSLADIACKYT